MLKASALYIVIIIALVVGLLCSSLIVSAYFYRLQYQRASRYDQLQNNVGSGINILIANQDPSFEEKSFSLFANSTDSVSLKKIPWGIYDIGVSRAFNQRDTLYKVFSIANSIDSTKWAALYLIDEDRPVSVSGKTMIKGDAYLSKAGVKEAYVDGKSYQGNKKLIQGKIHTSDKKLPDLSASRLAQFEIFFNQKSKIDSTLLKFDSVSNSFLSPTRIAYFGKKVETLKNIKLSGNIILFSDTSLIIENSVDLNNVIVFARSIIVKSGFKGTCQLFATDSIAIAHDCVFNYPSCLGILRFKSSTVKTPAKINFGENSQLTGLIFTYEKESNKSYQPLIDLGKNTIINGQIYSQGIVGLKDGVKINGSIFTSRFLYQSTLTRYENYIINTTIDATALSSYYLNSDLVPIAGKKKKILQWLETN
jgi:hypothetical protein